MTGRRVGLVAVLVCWTAVAWAAVPQTLHYSGKLDTAGGAFTGTIEVTFELYAGAGAKSSFWSETQAVAVQNGRFHAQLGSKTTLTPADVNVANLHLGVTVGTDDEMGKVPIASVPYAFRAIEAANAATVGGQAASSFATSSHTHGYAPLSHTHSYAPEHGHPYVNTGGGTLGGNLAMSSNKVTGLAAPTADADAATKAYVDAAAGGGGFSIKEVQCSKSDDVGNNVQCEAICPAGMKIMHSYVNCHFQYIANLGLGVGYVGEGFGTVVNVHYSCVRLHTATDHRILFRAYSSLTQNKEVNGEIFCITAN